MRYDMGQLGARLAWVGIAIALVTFLAIAVFVAGLLGYLDGGVTVTPKGNYSVSEAKTFRGFAVFYPGESANGYPLTAVTRDSLGPLRRDQTAVGFMYGDCKIPGGIDPGGCSLPVSISNEPACARNLGMYEGGPGSPVPHPTRIRGATGSFFEGGSRLELQTGTTTVVVFARSKREALSVARSLHGVNLPVAETDALPPPAPGALEGRVPCPR